MTADPLTPEAIVRWFHESEEICEHDDPSPDGWPCSIRAYHFGAAFDLDAARKASPPLDVERLVGATESVLGRGEVSTSDGSMGTDHAARLIAAAYDALDPRR